MNIVYTAEALATGEGRNGHARTSDGRLDLGLAIPKEMGGSGEGTNPSSSLPPDTQHASTPLCRWSPVPRRPTWLIPQSARGSASAQRCRRLRTRCDAGGFTPPSTP